MAKDPAFLFYYQDFSFGTKFFTNEEVGIYIRLLMEQADKGYVSEEEMNVICPNDTSVVRTKFVRSTPTSYINERLSVEIEKRKEFCESRKRSIQMRYKKDTSVVRMEDENENENISKERIVKGNHFDFEKIWEGYPNKDGKKLAIRYFKESIKTEEDYNNIKIALNNYINCKKVKAGYIKNGSTWFNNWKDWINYSEPKTEEEVRNERLAGLYR